MRLLGCFLGVLLLDNLNLSGKVNAFSSPQLPKFQQTLEGIQERLSTILPNDWIPPPTAGTPSKPTTFEKLGISPEKLEPKKFSVAPEQLLDILTSSFQAIARLGSGAFADGYQISIVPKDESKYTILSVGDYQVEESCAPIPWSSRYAPIEIYEFEGCPFCRKVREAVSILSLEVQFKPCPMDGPTYRREVKSQYGKGARFPFMRDPNTGVSMFESDDIVSYLFRVYGATDGTVPRKLRPGTLTTTSAAVGLIPRLGAGSSYKLSKQPEKPLILWAYEISPFCKVVKEGLCELELPYVQISCPRGSPNRQKLFEKTGRFQVPYLEDPNTQDNVALFESGAIVEYLRKQYAISPSPVKYL